MNIFEKIVHFKINDLFQNASIEEIGKLGPLENIGVEYEFKYSIFDFELFEFVDNKISIRIYNNEVNEKKSQEILLSTNLNYNNGIYCELLKEEQKLVYSFISISDASKRFKNMLTYKSYYAIINVEKNGFNSYVVSPYHKQTNYYFFFGDYNWLIENIELLNRTYIASVDIEYDESFKKYFSEFLI